MHSNPGSTALAFAVSVLPVLALLALFRRIDRARPVSRRSLYGALVLGAAGCLGAAVIEAVLHALLGDVSLWGARFVDAFVVTALTEEALKFAAVLVVTRRTGALVEVIDGVVLTVAAGLGLGLLENVALSSGDLATGLARAISAVPAHAIFSGVMGYFVGRAHFVSQGSRWPLLGAGLAASVALHGLYDWAVFNHGAWWFARSSAVLLAGGTIVAVLVRDALSIDEAMLGRVSLNPAVQTWPTNVTTTLVPAPVRPPQLIEVEPAAETERREE